MSLNRGTRWITAALCFGLPLSSADAAYISEEKTSEAAVVVTTIATEAKKSDSLEKDSEERERKKQERLEREITRKAYLVRGDLLRKQISECRTNRRELDVARSALDSLDLDRDEYSEIKDELNDIELELLNDRLTEACSSDLAKGRRLLSNLERDLSSWYKGKSSTSRPRHSDKEVATNRAEQFAAMMESIAVCHKKFKNAGEPGLDRADRVLEQVEFLAGKSLTEATKEKIKELREWAIPENRLHYAASKGDEMTYKIAYQNIIQNQLQKRTLSSCGVSYEQFGPFYAYARGFASTPITTQEDAMDVYQRQWNCQNNTQRLQALTANAQQGFQMAYQHRMQAQRQLAQTQMPANAWSANWNSGVRFQSPFMPMMPQPRVYSMPRTF